MKTYTLQLQRYTFQELNPCAREQALQDELQYLLNIPYASMSWNMKAALKKAESSGNMTLLQGYVLQYCQKEILEALQSYGSAFTESGHYNPIIEED